MEQTHCVFHVCAALGTGVEPLQRAFSSFQPPSQLGLLVFMTGILGCFGREEDQGVQLKSTQPKQFLPTPAVVVSPLSSRTPILFSRTVPAERCGKRTELGPCFRNTLSWDIFLEELYKDLWQLLWSEWLAGKAQLQVHLHLERL